MSRRPDDAWVLAERIRKLVDRLEVLVHEPGAKRLREQATLTGQDELLALLLLGRSIESSGIRLSNMALDFAEEDHEVGDGVPVDERTLGR